MGKEPLMNLKTNSTPKNLRSNKLSKTWTPQSTPPLSKYAYAFYTYALNAYALNTYALFENHHLGTFGKPICLFLLKTQGFSQCCRTLNEGTVTVVPLNIAILLIFLLAEPFDSF